MKEMNAQDFLKDAEKLLASAVANGDFLKIKTTAGNAVLISEAEWNILTDALRVVLHSI